MRREELSKVETASIKYEQLGVAMTCRSFAEYERMFSLTDLEIGNVLDVAAGASSFTATVLENGIDAYAVDPQYDKSAEKLYKDGLQELSESRKKLLRAHKLFNWKMYHSIDKLMENRATSLAQFIKSYKEEPTRYVRGQLPNLPFEEEQFSLILCSHFLFLYGEQFPIDFHEKAIVELSRICRQDGRIQIYPLVGFDGQLFSGLNELLQRLSLRLLRCKLVEVDFEFVNGATQMLVITKE